MDGFFGFDLKNVFQTGVTLHKSKIVSKMGEIAIQTQWCLHHRLIHQNKETSAQHTEYSRVLFEQQHQKKKQCYEGLKECQI